MSEVSVETQNKLFIIYGEEKLRGVSENVRKIDGRLIEIGKEIWNLENERKYLTEDQTRIADRYERITEMVAVLRDPEASDDDKANARYEIGRYTGGTR